MKIDKSKLNTLLRSGLKPEIKTRKQLAVRLGLDPTSLTRWFASRDRLGNPRYPVVPDRHVANILQIFDLAPDSLSLDNEKFRQHCFEIALQQAEENDDAKQKALIRLENIARRKMTIPVVAPQTNRKVYFFLTISIVLLGVAWLWVNFNGLNEQGSLATNIAPAETPCWTGYSASLASFEGEDEADPCNYGKLYYHALKQLVADNENNNSAILTGNQGAEYDYILFLFNKLEQRRIDQKILLNIELGRYKLRQLSFAEALAYFRTAEKMLNTLPNPDPKLLSNLSAYISASGSSDNNRENSDPGS